jgi:plasmid rolling circle replication initiator protein Rep
MGQIYITYPKAPLQKSENRIYQNVFSFGAPTNPTTALVSGVNCSYPAIVNVKSGALFNNTAQLGTNHQTSTFDDTKEIPTLSPKTTIGDTDKLKKAIGKKWFNNNLQRQLIAASTPQSVMHKRYKRSMFCRNTITVDASGKVMSHYCKQRCCVTCNAIRTAITMQRYAPVIEQWGDDIHFVTLTLKNVAGDCLAQTIRDMITEVQRIADMLKKRYHRGKGEKFEAIRKLEVTVNPYRDDYHPHFHFIVRGERNALLLLSQWQKALNTVTSAKAQDIRKADSKSIQELFKYSTKLAVSSTKKNKADKRPQVIYADMLNVVYEALSGIRTLQPVGFKLQSIDSEIKSTGDSEFSGIQADSDIYEFDNDTAMYWSTTTGEALLNEYRLPQRIRDRAKRIIVRKEYQRNNDRRYQLQRGTVKRAEK